MHIRTTAGASGAIGRFRLDLFYGLMLVPDLEVDYREAKAPQINPLAPESAVAVGGGKYRQLGHLAGLGLNVSF